MLLDLPRSAAMRLHSRDPRALLLAALWVVAIALDAVSTYVMTSSGEFEEANSLATPVFGALGLAGGIALLSAWAALLAFVSLARPTGVYSAAVVWTLRLVLVAKLAVAVSNIVLAYTGVDLL